MDKTLNIQTFGTFQILGMNGELGVQNHCAKTLVRMLAYFMMHRGEDVTVSQLANAIYADDEDIVDPNSAIRNLMWRLRRLMAKIWGEDGENIILTQGNLYHINEEISFNLDTELFDKAVTDEQQEEQISRRINLLMEAASLYRGLYLNGHETVSWIAEQQNHYHAMYLTVIKRLAGLLEEEESYGTMEQILTEALKKEQHDEELHCLFITALIKQGNMKLAEEAYKRAADTLYETAGHVRLNRLAAVYEEMMKMPHRGTDDLSEILNDLTFTYSEGAFVCEYGVFRQIYQLEVRRAQRLGVSVFVSLVSAGIKIGDSEKTDRDEKERLMAASMKLLQNVLVDTLRAGDVITRYSSDQFLLMLPTCQYETAGRVMKRIEKAFRNRVKDRRVEFNCMMNEKNR